VAVAASLAASSARTGAEHAPDHPEVSQSSPSALEILEGLLAPMGPQGTDGGFLHPDDAFVLSVEVRDGRTIAVRWTLADTYYLYRKAFRFSVATPAASALGPASLPPATLKDDPYFGRVAVYYREVTAVLPIERRTPEPGPLTLEIGYQGCTDRGLCYPPVTKRVDIELPRD